MIDFEKIKSNLKWEDYKGVTFSCHREQVANLGSLFTCRIIEYYAQTEGFEYMAEVCSQDGWFNRQDYDTFEEAEEAIVYYIGTVLKDEVLKFIC